MFESDEDGEAQLEELRKNRDSSQFNDYEKRFILETLKMRFANMSKHQKTVVLRLYGWLNGT